ncbi:MAG: IS21 family transposase, partial [Spirochaetota bacterium]
MEKKRVTMNKVRETIRLHEEMGLSNRKIARALRISHPVVSQYITDVKALGLMYKDIVGLSDTRLLELLEKGKKETERYKKLSEMFPYLARELKRTGINRLMLWDEYRRKYPEEYSYSQFCYHLQVWLNASEVTMHLEHKAGDKMFIDFAGKKLSIVDLETGELKPVETFVAILGASELTYVEAMESQRKEDWIDANENALWYFGGVPAALVPDNLKSGVTKGSKYEPEINSEYADFARHYGTVILPARPHSEKDKALVENAIRLVYSRIYASLRNRTFYSLGELNEAIWELLEKHNNMRFQRLEKSRQ